MTSFKLFLLSLFTLCATMTFAIDPESSRILIHTLNYLGEDYKNAVADGKVINEEEYTEMGQFGESAQKYYREFSTEWSDSDSVAVGELIQALVDGVQRKETPTFIAAKATEAKLKILAITGLKTFPLQYPDIANGQKLYLADCARCHGPNGNGDGPDGKTLTPKPLNFHDALRLDDISPAHAFNTIRLGLQGTGMPAYPTFKDDEVWDLAFYVISLRYQDGKAESTTLSPEIPLEKTATESDKVLRQEFSLTDEQLAALRLSKPSTGNDHFLNTAKEYLEKTITSYKDSKKADAMRYASLAYLEGIEPIELHLKASDPELCDRIESQFINLRKIIGASHPVNEVIDSIAATKVTIKAAEEVLQKREYSFWLALFMSMSILLREGLEAFLVILIILSVLKAAGITSQMKWVHLGWISAIVLGVILWFVSGELIIKLGGSELIEGFISILAVAMLLYIGVWLHGKSEMGKWKDYVNDMVKTATSRGSIMGMMSLSFFVVFREVFESVLFLSALNIESGGKQSDAITIGVILAFAIVIAFAFVAMRFSTRLPIPTLFKVSMWVMGLLAIVLTGKGIHSFQEVGYVPVHGIPIPHIGLLGIYPTVETTVGQVIVLLVIVLINRKKTSK